MPSFSACAFNIRTINSCLFNPETVWIPISCDSFVSSLIFNDLSLSFKVTPLGAVFGLLCSGLWILAAIYSIGYMRGNNEKNQTRFYIFYSLSIFGALCVAWSSNLLVLFIFYEFLTFATYPLVVHKETDDSIKASRLYLGILVGSSLMLFLPAAAQPAAGPVSPVVARIILILFFLFSKK